MFGFYASIDPKEDLTVKVAGEKDADEGAPLGHHHRAQRRGRVVRRFC